MVTVFMHAARRTAAVATTAATVITTVALVSTAALVTRRAITVATTAAATITVQKIAAVGMHLEVPKNQKEHRIRAGKHDGYRSRIVHISESCIT
jgi:hypothetical protein